MILFPRKTKYKKRQKGKLSVFTKKGSLPIFNGLFIKILNFGKITPKQLEACRISINRKIKKIGKLIIHIFPDLPLTTKAIGSRMGRGKGSFSKWYFFIKAGRVIFEIYGIHIRKAFRSLKLGISRLPVKSKIYKVLQ